MHGPAVTDTPSPPPSAEPTSGAALRALARAVELAQAGRLDDAEAAYAKLLAESPRDPTVLINAGALALSRGDVAAALARCARAVEVVPRNAIAHGNLGFALLAAGRAGDALAALDRAVAIRPDFAQAHNNRGIALARLGRRGEAVAAFDKALAIAPAYADAAINLGELANREGDAAAARVAFERIRDAKPAAARAGLAFADAQEGRLDEAMSALEALVAEAPGNAAFWQTLATVRNWAWRHDEAEAAFRRALALDPGSRDAQFGIASTLLSRGRYGEGFAAFEASRAGLAPDEPRLRALPVWDGRRPAQMLVVHAEQGFGDVVQFARFVPLIRPRVGRIVMFLEGYWKPLAPLMATLAGLDAVTTDPAALPVDPAAARVSVLSLPHLAEARPDALPPPPYLAAPAGRGDAWRARVAPCPAPRVGIAWSVRSRDDHGYGARQRLLDGDRLDPLLDVRGVTFVSLQPGAAGDPRALGPRGERVVDLGRSVADFGDTAALIEALDLVVSTDTAVVHVAGALGKPVWMLDRFASCWRWRLAAGGSPWYPAMRIFRQRRFGDWRDPVQRAAEALAAWRDARGA